MTLGSSPSLPTEKAQTPSALSRSFARSGCSSAAWRQARTKRSSVRCERCGWSRCRVAGMPLGVTSAEHDTAKTTRVVHVQLLDETEI